ncbi:MAG: hypothetical protein H0W27_07390 [Actinobacteria bacterium]|nr:hypothetical protein [Actinomycetota bacterium]
MAVDEVKLRSEAEKAARAAEAAAAKVRAIDEAREAEEARIAAIRLQAVREFDEAMIRGWPAKVEEFTQLEKEATAEFEAALTESDWGKALLAAWAVRDAQRLIASQLQSEALRLGARPPHEVSLREHNVGSEIQNVFSNATRAPIEALIKEKFHKPRWAAVEAAEAADAANKDSQAG